jgi:type IV pilus assembly protein PilY1
MKKFILYIGISLLFTAQSANAAFTEPNMADYTAFPANTANSPEPNIMIILDNSGSMNYNAYGTYPGNSKTVSDAPFTGEPYSGIKTFQISSGQDDAEENSAAGSDTQWDSYDLDLGGFNASANNSIVGLRFQDVTIPQGATIQTAYIEFRSNAYHNEVTNILIEGEASDDAAPFAWVADNIKGRTPTTATVAWSVPTWSSGVDYPTEDITSIVQEIVNRGGWASGNSMVFRFSSNDAGPNKRDARSYENGAATAAKLHVVVGDDPSSTKYYGYFNPGFFYKYVSNVFYLAYKKVGYDFSSQTWNVENLSGSPTSLNDTDIVNQGLWDGNWLNWLSMRRVDVLRKVLMGGLATARTGGGNQVNYGETPDWSFVVFNKKFDSGFGSAVSPYDGNYSYQIRDGRIYVDLNHDSHYNDIYFNLRIQKDIDHEPEEFVDGNLAGVLQKIDDKARWGNIWYNSGTGNGGSGGTVEHTIGTNLTSLVTDLQNTSCNTYTPLAETYYVAMQYFRQLDPEGGLDYPNNAVPNDNDGQDPYYNGTEFVPCAKSFVILLTDGASTYDSMVPSEYKDYDGDGEEVASCTEASCQYPMGGSDYLDDIALYARTVDLRPDLDGDQNLVLYAIHAFDKDPNATKLLRDAARNGGFDDRDGDNLPDGDYTSPPSERLEWDKDGDGEPDTFFEASDGYELEARLLSAIADIMKRASSGTTASVLATNNLGAGNSVQSYFRPLVTNGVEEAYWLGYLQSLWVDPWGNLREDSNNNLQLDLRSGGAQNAADGNVDMIVQMVNDGDDTVLYRYTSHYLYNSDNGGSAECQVGDCTPVWEELSLDAINPLFEAGKVLSAKDPGNRKIFTYIGQSGVVASGDAAFDTSGDVVLFDTGMLDEIKPFLGVSRDAVWGDGAGLGSDLDTRANNIIEWIRGTDLPGLRNRTIDNITWPLGDIVHSTPLVVGAAREYYHSLYEDEDYLDFIKYASNRETVIYVGANDGMMHAFTNYVYKKKDDGNQTPYYEPLSGHSNPVGDELWAYIPQSVLPHLKWTASVNYTHTYYVNSEPRVFDAKILPPGTHYPSGGNPNYGTFMVFGLNMGGKDISVNEDFGSGVTQRNFSPTYVLMDITDPRNPHLMWERSYTGLGMSTSVPAPVRVGSFDGNDSKWFLVFGSGATDYYHTPADLEDGHIFVVDLLTGEPYGVSATEDWIWESSNPSYFNAPLALDEFTSNNVDDIYLAENYYDGSAKEWRANVLKIAIPCSKCEWSVDGSGIPLYERNEFEYDANPYRWIITTLFESPGPVTAKLNSSRDPIDNNLLYFGTGRYLNDDDKSDASQQYLFAVKDPFYNKEMYEGTSYHDYGQPTKLDPSDLLDSTNIVVTTAGNVSGFASATDFWPFVEDVRENYNGWYVALNANGTDPSERIISQTALFGGLFLTPTFIPSEDICGMGGITSFLGGYYETGTGYLLPVFEKLADNAPETDVSIRNPTTYVGMPPSKLVVHVGQEKGTTVTIQLGTGEFLSFYGRTAISTENAIMEYTDTPGDAPLKNPACEWENF